MIKEKLKTLPLKPGCYLMKNKKGEVIYVGKAINLKNRVNSYFRGAHDYKTTKLVSNIFDFDYVVTKNEKEALILEYNLIKKYNPYFNIVFKDDKSYPYILLSNCYEPYLSVIRIKKNSKKVKGKLFGPYPDVGAARNTVSLLNKIYPLRKCEKLKNDYCLYYHIGECLGYCKIKIDENLINEYKTKVYKFLNGDNSEVLKNLNYLMKEASSKMEYEKAKEYRDLINDVKYSGVKQSVQINKNESFDVQNNDDFRKIVDDMESKDVIDIASDAIDSKMLETFGSKDMNRLKLIDSALMRIEQGKYGLCLKCGKKIPQERLEAIMNQILFN